MHSMNGISVSRPTAWIPVLVLLCLTSCDRPRSSDPRPHVVATTTIIGDAVGRIAGDSVRLTVLFPLGADAHHVHLSPRDVASISGAERVFINGGGLEGPLMASLDRTVPRTRVVDLSASLAARHYDHDHDDHDHVHEVDPHFWTDPHNMMAWARTIAGQLGDMRPDHRDVYLARANGFIADLEKLDDWIRTTLSLIPEERRKIVVDHRVFGYFCDRYGFEEVGVVIHSFSTLAQPSAREVGRLLDTIRREGVSAILVSASVNPDHAARIAADAGIRVVYYHAGSLSPPDGPAPDYLSYMRHNVTVMIDALKD